MGWWTFWKEYIKTEDYKKLARRLPNENWLEASTPYDVFGCTNFSGYLERYHKIRVMTVLDIFIVYTYFFYPDLFNKRGTALDKALKYSPYIYTKGFYEKWEKESKLIKLNA